MSAEKAKAFVECKHRNITWGDYPDVMLSLSKVQQAQSLLDASGLRSLFVVRATDRIFYTCLNDCAGQTNWVTFGAGHTTPEMQRTWSQSCTSRTASLLRCRLGKMQRDKGKRENERLSRSCSRSAGLRLAARASLTEP